MGQTGEAGPRRARTFWIVVGFALVFPALLSLADFVFLAQPGGRANLGQQAAYSLGKVVQFAYPVVCVWWLMGRRPRPGRPTLRGFEWGVAFGLVVVGGMLALYYGLLRDSPVFREAPARLSEKLVQFGVATPLAFAAFAFFLSVVHSLLEEYYWRWFVFGRVREQMAFLPAAVTASLAFMAHHVIILAVFLPGQWWTAILPFSVCVAGGGFVWTWLYERTGSVYAPWISHLLVDAGLFVIGYDLYFVRGA